MNLSTDNERTATDAGGGPNSSDDLAKPRPLRTWPAVLFVALMIVARFGPAYLEGGLTSYWIIALFGPLLCCVLMAIWWLTASRATWRERLFGLLGLAVSLAVTLMLVDATMRGPATTYLTLPMGMIAFAIGVTLLRKNRPGRRTFIAVLLAFAGFGFSTLLRNEGMTGGYALSMHWRWSETPEDSMLANRPPARAAMPGQPDMNKINLALANAEWPGFRGADRAARSKSLPISTNWAIRWPRQLWKIPVGPAGSSFAIAGPLRFTQEQRGPRESAVC
jgi:hypothetical protein